ncbi:MAG: 2-dehydropantoate 2-reductase [Pseudomonadota bacterium]
MHIGIVGAGGIGAVLAARLQGAGARVSLLARGAQLEAIRERGLRLRESEAAGGGESVARPAASDRAEDLGPADLVVFAVKMQSLAQAIEDARPLMGPGALAMPFQNGVDAPALLAEAYGPEAAGVGVAQVFANITGPGEATLFSPFARFVIGGPDGGQDDLRVAAARETFAAAGLETPPSDDVRTDLWMKFLLFNAVSGATAIARTRMGEVRAHPELWAFWRALVEETAAVARAEGVALPPDAVERTVGLGEGIAADLRASTAHDLEAGKPLEVRHIAGAVVRRGARHGAPTPASAAVLAALAPWIDGRPG